MRQAMDTAVALLAAAQHGVFSRDQVLAAGEDDRAIAHRLRTGRWLQARTGVYELTGLPPDRDRQLWAAWLAVGRHAVVSHETAGERHDLTPVQTGRLVFTTAHGDHHRLRGVTVHQLKDVLGHHVVEIDGLPTTTVARTIVDLAAVCSSVRLARIVENAVNGGVTTDDAIGTVLREVARQGKPGVGLLAGVLAERGPRQGVSMAQLERALLLALMRAGLPPPVPQFEHPGRRPGPQRVDCAYPDVQLILEADGRAWHQRIADLKRDRARDNAAARAGWLTMRFLWEELERDPDDVGRAVRESRSHRSAA